MYRVDISSLAGNTFSVVSGDAKMTIDIAEKENLGPLPTLLAALGSCIAVYLRRYADNLKLPIGEFSVGVEADLIKEPPVGFRKFLVSIDLKGAQLDEQRMEGLARFIKNCPVHNTLHGNPEIDFKIS